LNAYPISLQVVKLLGHQADRSPHREPILRMCGAIPLRPHMPSWREEVQLYLFDVVAVVVVQSTVHILRDVSAVTPDYHGCTALLSRSCSFSYSYAVVCLSCCLAQRDFMCYFHIFNLF